MRTRRKKLAQIGDATYYLRACPLPGEFRVTDERGVQVGELGRRYDGNWRVEINLAGDPFSRIAHTLNFDGAARAAKSLLAAASAAILRAQVEEREAKEAAQVDDSFAKLALGGFDAAKS